MLVRLNIIVNEHRFYLPGLGLIAICSWLLVRAVHLLSKRSRGLGFGAIVGVVILVLALGAQITQLCHAVEDGLHAVGVHGDSQSRR